MDGVTLFAAAQRTSSQREKLPPKVVGRKLRPLGLTDGFRPNGTELGLTMIGMAGSQARGSDVPRGPEIHLKGTFSRGTCLTRHPYNAWC